MVTQIFTHDLRLFIFVPNARCQITFANIFASGYPHSGVTLHRVTSVQRSQGDGEEQAPPPSISTTITSTNNVMKTANHLSQNLTPIQTKSSWISTADGAESAVSVQEVTREDSPFPEGRAEYKDNKEASSNILPKVVDIAHKLTKVSVTATPDSSLLNVPPKDLSKKNIIPLHPKNVSSVNKKFPSSRHKRNEPKFVPYEPYKACVKPIVSKKSIKSEKCQKEKKKEDTVRLLPGHQEKDKDENSQKNAEKVRTVLY